MTVTNLALGVTFAALATVFFGQARRATDGKAERSARLAGALFSVAAVAFLVAASLGYLTGSGA